MLYLLFLYYYHLREAVTFIYNHFHSQAPWMFCPIALNRLGGLAIRGSYNRRINRILDPFSYLRHVPVEYRNLSLVGL